MRAPDPSRSETLLTGPRAEQRRNRALVFGLPVVALLLGAAGAWFAVSLQKPASVAPAPLVAAAPPPAAARPEPPPQAAPEPAAAAPVAAPESSAAAKPAGLVAGKAKPRPTRKKGHDFGF